MSKLIRDPFTRAPGLAAALAIGMASRSDVLAPEVRGLMLPAEGVGVIDWNMGDDYAGDDYAGDDYAGDDYAGDMDGDALGDMVGDMVGAGMSPGEILGAVYRGVRRGRAVARRPAPPARRPPAFAARPGQGRSVGLGAGVTGRLPWRGVVKTNGVNENYEGLVRLPFVSATGSNVFGAGATGATFIGRPQKPWRGERLVAIVATSAGAATVIPLLRSITVGIDPQQAGVGLTPLAEYAPTSFGVRECWAPAAPGLDVTLDIVFSTAVPAAESVTIAISAHGRWVA